MTVDYTTIAGTATPGSDYEPVTGTLTFTSETLDLQRITVNVNGDTTFEPNETFTVRLSNLTGVAVFNDSEGLGTIFNDDLQPSGTPTPTPTPTSATVIRAISVATTVAGQSQITMPFDLESLGDETALTFSVNYNPQVFMFSSASLGNGAPSGATLLTNVDEIAIGRIGIMINSTSAFLPGTRRIVTITFNIAPNATISLYPVTFGNTPTSPSVSTTSGVLVPTTYLPGNIQLGSTAAGVEVSGRVLTSDGRGLRNAVVSLVDASGVTRRVTTSSFGVYKFVGIETGQAFLIMVSSKRYRYAPRILQVFDTLSDVDFVGIE